MSWRTPYSAIRRCRHGEGYREILGLDAFASEDEAAWRVFLAGLVE